MLPPNRYAFEETQRLRQEELQRRYELLRRSGLLERSSEPRVLARLIALFRRVVPNVKRGRRLPRSGEGARNEFGPTTYRPVNHHRHSKR